MVLFTKEKIKEGKELIKEALVSIKDKAINFAKDEGIEFTADIIENIPIIGKTIGRYVRKFKKDTEYFYGFMFIDIKKDDHLFLENYYNNELWLINY